MPVTLVSQGNNGAEASNVTAHTFTVPTVQDGDVMVLNVGLASSTTVTPSALFGTANQISSRSGLGHHCWVRVMSAADSGTVITLTTGSALKVAAGWVVLRGLTATPVDSIGFLNGAPATSFTGPAVTAQANKVVLQLAGQGSGSTAPATVYTPPSGLTVATSNGTGGTTGRGGQAIAVSTTPNQAQSSGWSVNNTGSWSVMAVQLNEAVETPTGVTGQIAAALPALQAAAAATVPAGPAFSISTTKTLPGTLIAPSDSRFRLGGADGWTYGTGTPDSALYQASARYPRTWGYPRSVHFEFAYTGRYFEVYFKHVSNSAHIRVLLNGVPLTDLMQTTGATSGGSLYYYRVDLGQAVTAARITVETNGMPWGGVVPDAGATVASLSPHAIRVIVQGDSTSDGSNENTGANSGTWALRLAHKRGWTDLWNLAIGGTGFTAPGTAVTILDRMQDVLLPATDLHFLFAGGNDGNTSITTAAQSYIDQYRAAHPTTRFIIIGTWGPTSPASTARQNRDAELEQLAITNGLEFASTITGRVRSKTGALLTTKTPVIASSANQAAYIGSDNVHPNDAGHERIATWMDEALTVLDADTTVAGTVAAQMPSLAAQAIGTATSVGQVTVTLPGLTAQTAGQTRVQGAATATLPSLTAAAAGQTTAQAQAAATLPALTVDAIGTSTVAAATQALLPGLAAQAVGQVAVTAAVQAALPALTTQAIGQAGANGVGTVTATLPALRAAAVGQAAAVGVAAAALPGLAGAAQAAVGEAKPRRDLVITSVTEPATSWDTTDLSLSWEVTDLTTSWGTTEPATDWQTTEPSLNAREIGELTLNWTTTEPTLDYVAGELTI